MIPDPANAPAPGERLELPVTGLYDDGLRRPGLGGPGIATALGSELHRRHQDRELDRDPRARAEVSLEAELEVDGARVRLRGRADLVRERDDHIRVEELKSYWGSAPKGAEAPAVRAALQLRTYAWILARQATAPVRAQLVWLPADEGPVVTHEVVFDDAETEHVVRAACRVHLLRARQAEELARKRRALAPEVRFPRPARRPGQERIEDAVARAVADGDQLLVHAPTGIGKTLAALVPALRDALANDRRIFFATASGTGRRAARAAIEEIVAALPSGSVGARTTLIQARASLCANDVVVCHDQVCRFAAGHAEATRSGEIVDACFEGSAIALPERIRAHGEAAGACPFALSLDASDRSVVTIGDLNYAFDPGVRLWPLDAPVWSRTVVIADEVHQLAGRVRETLSAELEVDALERAAEAAGFGGAAVHGAQRDLLLELARELASLVSETSGIALDETGVVDPNLPPAQAPGRLEIPIEMPSDALDDWLPALDRITMATLSYRAATGALQPDDPFLEVQRSVRHFARTLSSGAGRFATLATLTPDPRRGRIGLGVRRVCLDASASIGRLLGSLHAFVGLSGTLAPLELHESDLGLAPARSARVEVDDPFPAACRCLVIDPRIDTRFEKRDRHLPRIASTLVDLAGATPGATLALLPSHALVARVEALARARVGGPPIHCQRADDDEVARRALVRGLESGSPGLTLAVAGGVLAESLDLPAGALRCVVVVGPCLPPPSAEQQLLEAHYEELCDNGFAWGRLAPGMRRVIQAGGRLVRRESDRGLLVLLGRRFLRDPYRAALPESWLAGRAPEDCVGDPVEEARAFFSERA